MQKVILVIFLSCLSLELFSLPKYLATAGRNCQNCHSMKRLSENPRIDWEKMSYVHRRMSLSCKSCHINPGGGGIRTVVGRYYSQTSLPMFHISKHPDTKKNSPDERDKIPSHKAKFFYSNDFLSFGYPFNANSTDSQSRYAHSRYSYPYLNADPMLSLGTDIRGGLVRTPTGKTRFVPMQLDIGLAFHPVEHVIFASTIGFPAIQKPEDLAADPNNKQMMAMMQNREFTFQNAYTLIQELPLNSYVQGGLFLPSFGLRIEDHTAYVRDYLDMNHSLTRDIVLGGEIGMAPGHFYTSVSFFSNRQKEKLFDFTGYGTSLTLGWRDFFWGLGISLMYKDREMSHHGYLKATGLNGYYSLRKIPLTLLFDWAMALKPRLDDTEKYIIAGFVELNYLIVQGLNVKANYHHYQDDVKSLVEELNRFGMGLDWNVITGIRLSGEFRLSHSLSEKYSPGFILYVHGYL